MNDFKENNIYLYAEYEINNETKCQLIPSGNYSDLIYEDGMGTVCFKEAIYSDGYLIDCTQNKSNKYSIGTAMTIDEIRNLIIKDRSQIHEDGVLEFTKHLDKKNIWCVHPNKKLSMRVESKIMMPKMEGKPNYILKSDIIQGNNYWYIELHNSDDIRYEKTFLGDKKYRGQECDSYLFVLVCEYQIDGKNKRIIIKREDTAVYKSADYKKDQIDDLIDQVKMLVIGKYEFNGYAGTTPIYRYNTEDSACVFHDNKSLIKGQNVVTVTGSGDAILDLFLNGANKIVSFDTNSMATFWAELKFTAAKYLSYEDYISLIGSLRFEIYSKICDHLSPETKKVWDELYRFCALRGINIDGEDSKFFYKAIIFFTINMTSNNIKGYCNEENYYKLQEILKNKTIDDISFITCDIKELPTKADLSECSYAYLSNIMDFLVGLQDHIVDENALGEFKKWLLESLLPTMKKGANIDFDYIFKNWYTYTDESAYSRFFMEKDGFYLTPLSNDKSCASILSYRSREKDKDYEEREF